MRDTVKLINEELDKEKDSIDLRALTLHMQELDRLTTERIKNVDKEIDRVDNIDIEDMGLDYFDEEYEADDYECDDLVLPEELVADFNNIITLLIKDIQKFNTDLIKIKVLQWGIVVLMGIIALRM